MAAASTRRRISRPMWATMTLLGALVAGAAPTEDKITMGPIEVHLHEARTARIFHIVDQLSAWNDQTHRQYGRWATRALDATDRKYLARHAALRRRRGGDGAFESAFYVDLGLNEAAARAKREKLLSAAEADQTLATLSHLAPKLDPLLSAHRGALHTFESRLGALAPQLAETLNQVARFTGNTARIALPVILVPNPENGWGGGAYGGGMLLIEVQSDPDPIAILLREAVHALLAPNQALIERAARGGEGLNAALLSESIAYAIAPGLLLEKRGRGDSLAAPVVDNWVDDAPRLDAQSRALSFALVLRPLLAEALAREESIAAFLPLAVAQWKRAGMMAQR